DLRHTGNTWAAATGASTLELMRRMGHASAAAALRYQHATAERDREIADFLDAAIASSDRPRRAKVVALFGPLVHVKTRYLPDSLTPVPARQVEPVRQR
ncbi:MAG TPA: hypothetical protein VLL25_16315, partial [Acidimicrobiales bacterium]|nr:hypothetical protein [Acidimicrobiales bacterium]